MSDTKKTPAQIHVDALNRKRKPLIDFSKKPLDEALKAKDAEIENLTRQIAKLQEASTAKESYILELEGKLAKALNPQAPQIVPQTEEIPGTSRRRARVQVQPEEAKAPAVKAPEVPAIPNPGDGITEED